MQKKFEFDNVFSLNVFDDIKGELKVKHPNIKFFINNIIDKNDESVHTSKKYIIFLHLDIIII